MSEIDVTKCVFYGETMHPTKNCTMDSEYLHFCEGSNCYFKQLHRYKQAIEEIKEIASKVLLNTHDLEQFKDADALFGSLLEIHKKISEVK